MTKFRFYLSILFVLVAIMVSGCGTSATPTPRPPTPTLVAPPTLTPATLATATSTITATATVSATATVTPTAAATATRTTAARPAVSATPRVTATTAFKPPAPTGAIAFHLNKDGVDRTSIYSFDSKSVTPFQDIGPVMDVAGTATRGATNAHWGDWSPDNSKFAFIKTSGANGAQILYVQKQGTNDPPRSLDSSETGGALSSPSWSPAGDKIAYLLLSRDERVWKIKYAYYDATKDPADRVQTIRADAPNEQYRGGITWGKSGMLALAVNTTGASDIYQIDQNGGGFSPLTNNPADDSTPTFSPDGKLIAFSSTRDGNAQIYVMNADGTGARRLSKNTLKEFSPSWSPDGNWIAFTSIRDGVANIFIMDKNGGNVQQVTKDGGDNPVWSH